MIFYLITVLLGTVYPIFTEVLTNKKVSIGPPFYNAVIIPIVVLFLIFMSLGPNTQWIKDRFHQINLLIKLFIGSILINFFILFFFKGYSLLTNFIFITSIFLILSTLLDLFKSLKRNKGDI